MLREYGDIDAAIGELRTARRLARRAGSADREADVLATLGVALVFAGVVLTVRGRWDDRCARTIELLYLVLATSVVVHSVILPLPRYQWPMRPILYLLAFATLARLGGGRPGLAHGGDTTNRSASRRSISCIPATMPMSARSSASPVKISKPGSY